MAGYYFSDLPFELNIAQVILILTVHDRAHQEMMDQQDHQDLKERMEI